MRAGQLTHGFTWDKLERQCKTEGRVTICQHAIFAKGLYYNCLISSSTHNPRFEASNLDRKCHFRGKKWILCMKLEELLGYEKHFRYSSMHSSQSLAGNVTKSARIQRGELEG